MNSLKIETEIEIRRPVVDVFAMWTTADALRRWFAPMAVTPPIVDVHFAVGGEYEIAIPMPDETTITTRGKYLEIVPNERIVMTWRCSAFPDPETIVTVRFSQTEAGTRINLSHARFVNESTCDNHTAGWAACLAALTNFLESAR